MQRYKYLPVVHPIFTLFTFVLNFSIQVCSGVHPKEMVAGDWALGSYNYKSSASGGSVKACRIVSLQVLLVWTSVSKSVTLAVSRKQRHVCLQLDGAISSLTPAVYYFLFLT